MPHSMICFCSNILWETKFTKNYLNTKHNTAKCNYLHVLLTLVHFKVIKLSPETQWTCVVKNMTLVFQRARYNLKDILSNQYYQVKQVIQNLSSVHI